MAVRPINASRFAEILEQWKKDCLQDNDQQSADVISDVILQLDDMPTLTQPNEPLTLEQLREMDGQPVFLETGEVSIREQLIAEWEILTEHDDSCFYFTLRKRGFHIKDYGKTWIAYRRPPEGEEK